MRSASARLTPSTLAMSSTAAAFNLTAAEMLSTGPRAGARADPGDILQPAGRARLLALAAMASDGVAVRLVAHLLHQLQGGRSRAGPLRARPAAAGSRRRPCVPGPSPPRPGPPRPPRFSCSTSRLCATCPAPPSISSTSGSTMSGSPSTAGRKAAAGPDASRRNRRRARCRRCLAARYWLRTGPGGIEHHAQRPPSPRP